MIVKNEAHCISKCLESVKPHISSWVICDTGSTDNTEEVVRKTLKGIPGEFHKNEWEDFATNRNISLELARKKLSKKGCGYILFIDADDQLVVEDKLIFNQLINPIYRFKIHHGPIIYNRIELVRHDIPAKYVGVCHEYLDILHEHDGPILDGCYIKFGGVGARSQDPQKYLKDASLFEKALLKEPKNDRYVFYCGQSYRDAGIRDKAMEMYLRRGMMGGWIEEQYVAYLEAGKIAFELNRDKVDSIMLMAQNCHPGRNEALCYLAAFNRELKNWHKAYFYAKIGSKIQKPVDGLFLEVGCYDYKIFDELSIAAFYIGKTQEAKQLMNLLICKDIPKDQKERIRANLKFL